MLCYTIVGILSKRQLSHTGSNSAIPGYPFRTNERSLSEQSRTSNGYHGDSTNPQSTVEKTNIRIVHNTQQHRNSFGVCPAFPGTVLWSGPPSRNLFWAIRLTAGMEGCTESLARIYGSDRMLLRPRPSSSGRKAGRKNHWKPLRDGVVAIEEQYAKEYIMLLHYSLQLLNYSNLFAVLFLWKYFRSNVQSTDQKLK